MAPIIKIYDNPAALARAAATLFVRKAREAVDARGKFIVSLSGGSTPESTFRLLAEPSFARQVPWESVYVFWGDERMVPKDDPANNARMAEEALLQRVPVPENHIFAMDTVFSPKEAARQYHIVLKEFFKGDVPVFDLFFLGMGEDGHTASLFPGTPVLNEQARWAKEVFIEKMNTYRVTLTVPVINNASHIVFLIAGSHKASTLEKVLKGPYTPGDLPAQLVNTTRGEVIFLLDKEAARKISGP